MTKRSTILVAVLAGLLAPCAAAGRDITLAAFPSNDPEKLGAVMRDLSDYLTERLGRPVTSVITRDYAETAARLAEGSADVAWLGPLSYVQAVDEIPGLRYLATYVNRSHATGEVAPYYRSVIVVAKTGGIETLADLKGKRFAFTDPESASGYAFPVHLLRRNGIDPDRDFAKVFFLKRHDRVLDALRHGSVDAGALADEVYYGARRHTGDAFTVIGTSEPIPMVAVAASARLDADTAARIQAALVAMPSDHRFCRKMRETFGWDAAGFRKRDDSLYDPVRAVYGRR